MHSYVTPADDAPLGVRKRGLSKGKAGSVREQVESWRVWGKGRKGAVGVVDFGTHFWPPLHGIGTPGSGFWTKFRSGF